MRFAYWGSSVACWYWAGVYAQQTDLRRAGAALGYYPATSAKWDEFWKDYGIFLAGSAFGNMIHEFMPDFVHYFRYFRHKNQSH